MQWKLACGAVLIFFAITTILWVRRDLIPPQWDSAQYLAESVGLYRALAEHGLRAFLRAFIGVMGTKAPLITALPLPFYAVLGESHLSAKYVNVVFVVLACWYLFRLGEMLAGRRAALLSVVILNTFPLVAGMARHFLTEYGLMTLVILWLYYVERWEQGERRVSPWLLGLTLGLGMLMKVTFPLYIAAPTIVGIAVDARRTRRIRGKDVLRAALPIVIVAAVVAGPWYAKNLPVILGYIHDAGYGNTARYYSTGSVFSIDAIKTYWHALVEFGIGTIYAVLLIPAILFILRRGGRASFILLSWSIVPALALTFTVSKDTRFAIPYLPAVALMIAAACAALKPRPLRIAACSLVALFGIASYLNYSFTTPGKGWNVRFGNFTLIGDSIGWAHPPTPQSWPNEALVHVVAADAAQLRLENPKATLLVNEWSMNAHNFNYSARRQRSPVLFDTCSGFSPEPAEHCVQRIRSESDYVLIRREDPPDTLYNHKNVEVTRMLLPWLDSQRPLAVVGLPDGTHVSVFHSRTH